MTSSSPPSSRSRRAVLGQVEQRPDGAAGPLARAQLEHLAQQDQDGDHRGRLEVDRDRAVRPAEARGEEAGATVATTL